MDLDELDKRLKTAEGLWDNLTIRGPGWAGDSQQGFIFNPRQGGVVTAGGVTTCFPITLVFSGIVMDCGCQLGAISTDVSVNGTFNLTSCVVVEGVGIEWGLFAAGTIHQVTYPNPDCSGVPTAADAQLSIDVQFIFATNTWIVNYQGSAVTASIFVLQGSGVSSSLPTTVTNTMSCGTTGGYPGGFFAGYTSIAGGSLFGFGSGHGGSVTISRT